MATPVVTWSSQVPPFGMNAKFTPSPSAGVVGGAVPTAKVLQGAVVGTAYTETISAQGGTAPYTFAVTVGSLPTGLSLNGTTGVISGTPTAAATSDFTIMATDSTGTTGSTDFEIGVTTAFVAGAIAGYTSGPLRRNPLRQRL